MDKSGQEGEGRGRGRSLGGAWEALGRGCGPAGREVGKKADEEMDVR